MKVLFQGDSITDWYRNREDCHDLGKGYVHYSAKLIKQMFPSENFEFINLGISGDRTENLVARLQNDFIDIQPDICSIMIGINDTWHKAESKMWLPDEYFEENYRTVLRELKEKTSAKIIILEQFLLPVKDKLFFREDLDGKIDITRSLAREYADVYIPLDGLFAAACVEEDMYGFSDDGVHPNINGAKFIAKHYLEAFKKVMNNG